MESKARRARTPIIVRALALTTLALLLAACEQTTSEFSQPEDDIWLGGPPNTTELNTLAEQGVGIAIDLRGADEADLGLAETTAEAVDMTYLNVPVSSGIASTEAVDAVAEAIEEARDDGDGILIHCASGNRAGEVWAMYQVFHRDVDVPTALAQAEAAGTRGERLQRLRAHLGTYAAEGRPPETTTQPDTGEQDGNDLTEGLDLD